MSELDLAPAHDPETRRAAFTERQMLDMLHARYSFVRPYTDTRRYAVAEHVSNIGGVVYAPGGYVAERIADFIAQDTQVEALMPSGRTARPQRFVRGSDLSTERGERRQVLHGHEVKVSRSDWLAELRDPTKADAWRRYCDRWWLVAPRDVVRDDLPVGWGHLAPDSQGRLRVVVQAPLLTPEPMPVHVRAQVMRAVAKTATRTAPKETDR